MNIEKGKRALMVLAKPASTEADGHHPDGAAPLSGSSTGASRSGPPASPSDFRPSARGKPGAPSLDRGTQSRIGDKLRAMYNDLMDQPVPDKFRALLDQLDQRKEEDRQ